jgi:sortase A
VIEARGVHFTVGARSIAPLQSPNNAGADLQSAPKRSEASYKLAPAQDAKSAQPQSEPGFADILSGPKEQLLIPKDTQFSIVIPKIGASAKVFANVDPNNPDEFMPILLQGIAHAKGSVFPGMQGNIYLFAHSTDTWFDVGRYNAVFYLLHDLQQGDDIVIFFDNKRYDYTVTQTLITGPEDVSLISRDHNGPERLVLQTCWPPGTSLQRFYVVAEPKKS